MGWGKRQEPLMPTEPVRWPVTQAACQLAGAVRRWREWPSMNAREAMLQALDHYEAVVGDG